MATLRSAQPSSDLVKAPKRTKEKWSFGTKYIDAFCPKCQTFQARFPRAIYLDHGQRLTCTKCGHGRVLLDFRLQMEG